jgi:F-type H+-transporting ATPase subunit epsilon
VQVELVSPERILYSGDAEMVIARTVGGGDIAFLSGHAPFVGALEIATATVRTPDGDQVVAIHGGFVEVSGDTVTILSDVAELAEDIDVGRAERARREAEREHETHDGEATANLRRAHVRLNAAGGGPSG